MAPNLARGERIGLAIAAVACLVTRTWHLTALPMFFDEAIHMLWGGHWVGPNGLTRALTDGKLLQVMASGVALRLVPQDPLWAVRSVTALSGLVTLAAVFFLGRRIGGAPGGLIAASLSVASPFLLFHERMALADPLVAAFAAVALVATIGLCDDPRPIRGVMLGVTLAAAGATKVLGLFALAPSLAGVLLLAPRDRRAWRYLGLAWGVAGILLWGPVSAFLTRTNQIAEKAVLVTEARSALVVRNLGQVTEWLWIYWTPTVIVVGLVATGLALTRRRRVELVLLIAWALPLVVLVFMAGVWYPRYVLFTTGPFLALAGGGLGELWVRARGRGARGMVLAIVVGVLAPGLVFHVGLAHDPASVRLPEIDRWQYIEGWPSGYGWAESYDFLVREHGRDDRALHIVTEHYHWTLKAYFVGRPGVVVKAFDVWNPSELARAATWVGREPGWLVVSKPVSSDQPPGLELTHAAAFTKPGRRGAVHVYRLRSPRREPSPSPSLAGDAASSRR
jgi:4-amino-4-deoxy-L-arabinose transferase-like glycosyltransferase